MYTWHNAQVTSCTYNFPLYWLGYVQGMSDLLAPLLSIMDNEVDAFWCFAGLMEIVVWTSKLSVISCIL